MRVEAWQQLPQWCWAASIQMAFRSQGYEVSQSRIVESTYGRRVNLPAWGWQIHRQVARTWIDDNGKRFVASSRTLIDTYGGRRPSMTASRTAHEHLDRRAPLIIGTGGHAMLLVAQESLKRRAAGIVDVRRAMVIDPWPFRIATDQFKYLMKPEIWATAFLATVEVSPA